MNLSQVDYLITVLECSSIKKAAEILGVKRTTLLMSLESFEEELGQNILIKKTSGTSLSPDKSDLYPILKKMKNELIALENLRQAWSYDQNLQIFSFSSIFVYLIEKINASFLTLHPNKKSPLKVQIPPCSNADFVFSINKPAMTSHNYTSYKLFDSPYCICMRSSHPLAKEKTVILNDIPQIYPLFILSDAPIINYNYQIINNISSLQRIISTSDCLALIPKVFIRYDILLFSKSIKSLQVKACNLSFTGFLQVRNDIIATVGANYLNYVLSFFKE